MHVFENTKILDAAKCPHEIVFNREKVGGRFLFITSHIDSKLIGRYK